MVLIDKVSHKVRNTDYEILLYNVKETKEYQICVYKGGFGVGDFFSASEEVVKDAKIHNGKDIVEMLIYTAIDDINRNEFNLY